MSKKSNKRKTLFIDKKFQIALIGKFLLLITFICGIIILVIELFFNKPFKFKPVGKTILLKVFRSKYQNNKLAEYSVFNSDGNNIYKIILKYNSNNNLVEKHKIKAGRLFEKVQIQYNIVGNKINKKIYKKGKLTSVHQYKYYGNKIKSEIVLNKNLRPVKFGKYNYKEIKVNINVKKIFLSSIIYYKIDFAGKITNIEIDKWDYYYKFNSHIKEAHYKRKDGMLYLIKVFKFQTDKLKKIKSISLYEDKFTEQFKDFLFKPVYNKDGDIIGLLENPVNRYRLMILPILITSGILSLVVLLYVVFLSHRMAGPIYRLNKYLNDMKNGIFGKELKLRRKDDFKDLAINIEELSKILETRFTVIENYVESVLNNEENNENALTGEKETNVKIFKKLRNILSTILKKKNK